MVRVGDEMMEYVSLGLEVMMGVLSIDEEEDDEERQKEDDGILVFEGLA